MRRLELEVLDQGGKARGAAKVLKVRTQIDKLRLAVVVVQDRKGEVRLGIFRRGDPAAQ
jgi:hypothetical protein